MFVDTASSSRLVSDTSQVMINGIIVIPSAGTWAIVLKDGSGNVIYQANENSANSSYQPTTPFLVTGLVVDTLTTCTALIYTIPS